uniref:VWFA domain-containing protein n=1 Tax=Clytia hemisphaerica TaxID=252671 RepID=A0A7M5UND3_9CNID
VFFFFTIEPSIYFYRLYITDQSGLGRPTTIQWLIDGQITETIRVPSNVDRYPITKRFLLKRGQMLQCRAFTEVNSTSQLLYVNERLTFDPNHLTPNYHGDILTIGEPISRRLYYFRLMVDNLDDKTAVLKWDLPSREGVITHSRIIPAFSFNYVVFANVEAYEQPSEITLTSYVNGTKQQLYTNDQKSFPVNAVSQKRPTFYKIYISRQVTIRKETMLFNNPTNEDMQVTWQTFGNRETTIVPAKSTNYRVPVSLTGGFRSQSILLRVQDVDGEKALINSNRVINIRLPHYKPFIIDYPYKTIIFNNSLPSDVAIKGVPGGIMQTIRAGEDINFRIALRAIPTSGITFTAVNQFDDTPTKINGKDSVVVPPDNLIARYSIGTERPISREYSIKLWLTNNHTNNVALKWTEGSWQRVFAIQPNFNGETVLSFNSDAPVTLSGNDVNTNNYVYLNRRQELVIRPTPSAKYATNVVISGEIALYDYFYRLIVNNERNTDVDIVLKSPKETTRSDVPALRFKYIINTPLFDLVLGPKQPIKIYVFMKDGTPLYVNGKDYVDVLPSLNDDEATVINVGKEIPVVQDIARFVVYVTNNLNVDVELQHQVGDKRQKYNVKANAVRSEIMINNPSDDSEHEFSAFLARRYLAVNQKPKYVFNPRNGKPNSQGLMTLNLVISGLKIYYVIQVENIELYPIILTWLSTRGTRGYRQLSGKSSSKLVIRNENPQSEKPGPIAISCYRPTRDRRIPIYINNKKAFTANPVYDIDTAQRAVISADLEPTRQNFLRFDVTNYVNNDVTLYWSHSGEIDFERSTNFRRINAGQQNKQIKISFPLQQTGQVQFMAYDSVNREILRLNNRQRLFIQPTEKPNVERIVIAEKAALDTPQDTYYLHLQVKNNNQNPIELQYKQAGSDGPWQQLIIPALYHQWFYLPFNRIAKFPMSVQFRICDTVDLRHLTIANHGSMFLWQPSSKFSTEQLTVGNTIPKKIYDNPQLPENADGFPYFLSLHVWNRGERNTRLYWNEPGSSRRRYLSIPAKSFREYTYVVRSKSQVAPWIFLSVEKIYYDGRFYIPLIDGYKSLDAVRLQRTKRKHFLFIEHERQREVRYYRYGIQFINMASHGVLFKWNENSIQRKQYVRPLSSAQFYGVMFVPKDGSSAPNLRVEAFNPATNERVLLNGDEYASFEIFEKMRLRTVYVESDSQALRMRTYFMGYDVTNLYPEPVIMKWREGDQDRTMVVPPHGSMYYDTSLVSSSRPVVFPVSATFQRSAKPAPIYGQMSYNVQWSPYRRRHSILIGNLDSPQRVSQPTEYQLAFKLKNIAQVPLTVKWTENGVQKSANIEPGQKQRYTISVKSYTEPPQLVFRVYKQGTDQLGTINGQMTLEAQPKENSLVSLWTLNFGEVQETGQRCGDILDVAILLDSSGTMRGGYSHAKEFIKTFADYYHLGPNSTHIGVISFSEEAHLHVPFNAHQEHLLFNEDIDQIPFYGYRTRLDLAFKMADTRLYGTQYGTRDGATKMVLLITDGRQNDGDVTKEKLRLASQASQGLLNKNVKIIAIGLYGVVDPDEKMLTTLTGSKDRVHIITKYEQLYSNSFIEALTDDVC